MRIIRWISEWVETWRVAPPFSRRRRNLIAIMNDTNPDHWIDVKDYWNDDSPTTKDEG